ncbi:Ca2+-dependent lipid-binding protein, contains C2 domain protein [Pyrenophora tritici-repentis]|nr:C2 domain-containing protein [Pyrenophora tritici-repentis]KAI1680401.1 C2 domain-containing protein [Pyrenophora tritici-repentis]PZD26102.1 Ca2+-dependent lipid-binding protein, contains C2 domain protein [Pyrenophora tritici-repentis]
MANQAPASLVEQLTASGGAEPAGFLNDIVSNLWPNICIAGSKIIKESVEPVLASTLPGPLKNLRFVKIDFGHVPISFSNVDVHKTKNNGIKLDMDLNWDGVCDFELDGKLVPKVGVERVRMKGRISVLLCPLTNVIPLIGAAQVAFLNTPSLELDFTDAANIADLSVIDNCVRKIILGIIGGMFVLPNRFLVKMDNNVDYFKTYQPHHGLIRVTIARATNIAAPKQGEKKKSTISKLMEKVKLKDVPDCYAKVIVGAEAEWKTSVVDNNTNPEWNETHDFIVTDFEQNISIDIQDEDTATGDDDIGFASTTVKDILLQGGSQDLSLSHKNTPTGGRVLIHAKFFNFVNNAQILSSAHAQGQGQYVGLATILIASAHDLQGPREELQPSVKVTWGTHTFQTAVKTYTPGTDIYNPSFDQAFRIPLTADMLANPGAFQFHLLNKTTEFGSAQIGWQDVLGAEGLMVQNSFDMGNGAKIRAAVTLHGVQEAQ